MEGGGSAALPLHNKNNNLNLKSVCTQVQTKWGEFYEGFNGWVSKQPFLIETTVAAATYALQGVASGFMFGTLAQNEAARNFYPFQRFGKTRALQVRNFAILRGTDGALISAMRRIRGGKDDTSARMVAGFYSGYVFQMLIRNSFDPGAPDAIAVGLFLAFCHGLMHEVQVQLKQLKEDTRYTRATHMLSNLGLQSYEKNFKQNLLTDKILPLLTYSDLAEAGIPIGPRVLILNHISSEKDTCYTRARRMLSNLGLQNYKNNFYQNLLTDKTLPLLTDSDLAEAGIPPEPRVLILNHIKRDADLAVIVMC